MKNLSMWNACQFCFLLHECLFTEPVGPEGNVFGFPFPFILLPLRLLYFSGKNQVGADGIFDRVQWVFQTTFDNRHSSSCRKCGSSTIACSFSSSKCVMSSFSVCSRDRWQISQDIFPVCMLHRLLDALSAWCPFFPAKSWELLWDIVRG